MLFRCKESHWFVHNNSLNNKKKVVISTKKVFFNIWVLAT